MKKFYLIILFALIFLNSRSQVEGQSFEEFKRQYEEFVEQERERYSIYKAQRDKEFADFLRSDWEQFKLFSSGEPLSFPGPERVPDYTEDVKPEELKKDIPAERIPQSRITVIPIAEPIEAAMRPTPVIVPALPREIEIEQDIETLQFVFYGTEIEILYPKELQSLDLKGISERSIADFWEKASQVDMLRFSENLLAVKNNLFLNDFAYLKLLEMISENIFDDKNKSKLLTWFLLIKTGYEAKSGYSEQDIHLMIPVSNQLYGLPFYIFNNINYYVFEHGISGLRTYHHNYPEALRVMDFNMFVAPDFESNTAKRNLEFNYHGIRYDFEIEYNLNHIDFYSDYPQGDIMIFFNAGMSSTAKNSLVMNFDSLLYNSDEIMAADFLLRFTQTAFDYKTDEEQFGYERYFFPEELLHYPYSDCEDRSVFFAWMMKELLNIPVIGLNYPGHIATAVNFNQKPGGTYFILDEDIYTVCDPTYINAPIGAAMPEFKNSEVKLLSLNNTGLINFVFQNIWKEMQKQGLNRFLNTNDIIMYNKDLFILAGYFDEPITINNNKYYPSDNETGVILAKVNDKAEIIKAKKLTGTGDFSITGLSLIDDNIYLAGRFSNKLFSSSKEISTQNNQEFFAASFGSDLKNNWLVKTDVYDEYPGGPQYFRFYTDRAGKILQSETISAQSFAASKPIEKQADGMIYFSGYFNNQIISVIDSEIYSTKTTYGFALNLKNAYEYFLLRDFKPETAGLYGLLSILFGGDIEIAGEEIIVAANSINREFKENYSILSKHLTEIENVKSSNNIISISTSGNDLNFGPIRFENNSKFRIRINETGNINIETLSGIAYRPFLRTYDVNSIEICDKSGDVTVDYNHNRIRKKLNIKKDLLK